jgi:glycosyltransferase involved in cell wall biosynthesis
MEIIPHTEISDHAVLSKTPVLSVKMLTYNHEKYIAQAIEGVLQQKTDFPIELVIGEDCSTDRTREIVLEYQKRNPSIIRVLVSENNVGGNNNSKRTSNACRGKYIAYCEGDDFWHDPNKLQIQVNYLEAHPECGLVHSDYVHNDVETGEKILFYYRRKKSFHDDENVLKNMLEVKYIVKTCTAVLRKDLLDEIFDTCQYEFSENFLMMDSQLWMEFAYRSKVKFIDESLATYNRLPESACHSRSFEKSLKFSLNSKNLRMYYADKYGRDDEIHELKKLIASSYNKDLLTLACLARKPELVTEIIQESKKYNVPLGPFHYLYSISSRNTLFSHLYFAIIAFIWRCRQSLGRIKWLSALRDKVSG